MRLLVFAILMLFARPAWSQVCLASASAESFGTYNPLSATATTSTATVTVTCQSTVSVLVSYTIALGGGSGGAVTTRSMSSGGATLSYQLYRDVGHTQVWGDGTGGSVTVTDGYLLSVITPVVRAYTAYGVIPAGSRIAPGMYGDVITILMTY